MDSCPFFALLRSFVFDVELLILDDWGLEAVNAEQRNALLEIMDDRYGKYSTVVVSQSAANGRVVRELGGQHPGRCDPGPADAQRSPAVTEGRIDEKEEK